MPPVALSPTTWHHTPTLQQTLGAIVCRAVAPCVRRTPGISCEAVPAFMPLTGAGMRRHAHSGNHAAESFVSFIPLFGGAVILLAWRLAIDM
jgi:hypothetical protein